MFGVRCSLFLLYASVVNRVRVLCYVFSARCYVLLFVFVFFVAVSVLRSSYCSLFVFAVRACHRLLLVCVAPVLGSVIVLVACDVFLFV